MPHYQLKFKKANAAIEFCNKINFTINTWSIVISVIIKVKSQFVRGGSRNPVISKMEFFVK